MGTLRTTNIQHPDASAAGMILAADGTVSGLRATQNTQSGTTYSLASTDSGRTVTLSNAAAVTVTLPAQATVAWNVGETLSLLNLGVGTVTITPAATVTINGTPLTLTTSKGGSLVRTASNTWTFIPAGAGGKVLQVVSVLKSDTFTTTSASYIDVTGLAVTITPSSSTSTIMVICSVNASQQLGVNRTAIRLMRGATAISVGTATSNRTPASASPAVFDTSAIGNYGIMFLDAPTTTSATTYKIQITTTSSGTAFVNRGEADPDTANQYRTASNITVMEISA